MTPLEEGKMSKLGKKRIKAAKPNDGDEILDSLEKEALQICYHTPDSTLLEQRLANILACLIAVVRNDRNE